MHAGDFMSTSLIVLLPVILLGIVGMLCFVGCILPSYGLGPSFTTYTTTTILLNKDCIAYWPLKEVADTTPAAELISGNTGNYIDPTTAPSLYPWPDYSIPNGSGPDVLSAAAPGTIALAQTGIVVGDVVPPLDDPVPPACVVVNGCYVEVPWKDKFIPKTSFTVEAWVRVDWTASDPQAWRFVLDSRELSPVTTGFGIFAKADDNQPGVYRWAAVIGDGSSAFIPLESTELTITLKDPASPAGMTFYLALTYDSTSQTLTLFVNGDQHGQVTSAYAPNATQPLWIGAGSPYVPRRTQPAGPDPASPLFPFVGAIQDVAIYKIALAPGTILTHFNNGNGTDPQNG
jgi:Concanavalin A-like lectin/glucanases superfamily